MTALFPHFKAAPMGRGYMNLRALNVSALLAMLILPSAAFGADASQSAAIAQPFPDFSNQASYRVERIIDGDTVELAIDGQRVKVRLVGIDTPESHFPGRPVERYADEATEFVRGLIDGRSVYLEYDAMCDRQDSFGRTLAHLYRAPDGLWVNLEIVREGLGIVYDRFPFTYQELFQHYEDEARAAARGLWSTASAGSAQTGANGDARTGAVQVVYVTKSGAAYHRHDCPHLGDSKTAVLLGVARDRGLKPCGACRPPVQ
jgi:micrococcal nuclease